MHNTNASELTEEIRHTAKERQKSRMNCKLFGKSVCRDTFSYAHGIDKKTVDNITKDILCNWLEPRNHGNKRKHCPWVILWHQTVFDRVLKTQ